VRGVAVVAVLLFHGGKLTGGYLGVDLFFVLSGYLITSLLLVEISATSTIRLGAFWIRRARRLLPALGCVLVFVAVYATVIAQPSELHRIRLDALATMGYVANWRDVFSGFDYFALFTAPSPLNHTWSLAIEEQFYVVWPLVVAGLCVLLRRRNARRDRPVVNAAAAVWWLAAGLVVVSAAWALLLWRATHDPTRVYYGTDTRAAAILLGAALGAWTQWRGDVRRVRGRYLLEAAGLGGAIVLGIAWSRLDGAALYRGGLLACSVAGVAVVAAAAQPRPGALGRILGLRPLVGLGLVSYGLYLWHWPLYLWLDADRVGWTGWPLLAVRIAVTLGVATVSYFVVERPIRRGAVRAPAAWWIVPSAVAAVVVVTLAATAGYVAPRSSAGASESAADRAARAAAGQPGARRLMVIGNSVAFYLGGEGFAHLHETPPLVTLNAGKPACAYPDTPRMREDGFSQGHVAIPCDTGWYAAAKRFRPDVVLLILSDSGPGQFLHGGRWLTPCSHRYAAWFRATLTAATRRFAAVGSRVVLTTAPYSILFGTGEHDWRETDCTNDVFRSFARDHTGVGVVELQRFVCPSPTACRATLHGETLRPDGLHFRHASARLVARWMLPRLGLPGG
jgi:peptidoglycan/LPS O-acetylase OafA/YrhL